MSPERRGRSNQDQEGARKKEQLTAKKSILLVDDLESFRVTQVETFKRFSGEYELSAVATRAEVIKSIDEKPPDVVLLDYKLGQESGIEILKELAVKNPEIKVIMLTSYGRAEVIAEAKKHGAFDYLDKPFEHKDLLKKLKEATRGTPEPAQEIVDLLENELKNLEGTIMVGKSEHLQEVFKAIGSAARNDVPVLITGETGTGKEVSAKLLHLVSDRALENLVTVHCVAIPDTIMEDEFFGHLRGAFTGAYADKPGYFEKAHKGTIVLDEVGDINLEMQKKLLRVIEYGTFYKLGASIETRVDVRLVALTNKDLRKAMEEGKFLPDLFYRLSVFPIHIPPLRERPKDVSLLIAYFLKKHGKEGKPGKLTEEALGKLKEHEWYGNARELENTIEGALARSGGRIIEPQHIALTKWRPSFAREKILPLKEVKAQAERETIELALRRAKGNTHEAARILEVSRSYLLSLLTRYKIITRRI